MTALLPAAALTVALALAPPAPTPYGVAWVRPGGAPPGALPAAVWFYCPGVDDPVLGPWVGLGGYLADAADGGVVYVVGDGPPPQAPGATRVCVMAWRSVQPGGGQRAPAWVTFVREGDFDLLAGVLVVDTWETLGGRVVAPAP